MELKNGHNNKRWVCFFEAIGTSNLAFALNTSASFPHLQHFAVGLTLFGNICILGSVSGGHFNPAVTVAVLIAEGREKMGSNFCFAILIIIS